MNTNTTTTVRKSPAKWRKTTVAGKIPLAAPEPETTSPLTIGLDLGDRKHSYCVLDAAGRVIKQDKVANEREAMAGLVKTYPKATVVMEAGTHSPWISRFFTQLGCSVIVANPRKVRAIYQNERKSDDRDAMMLARIARMDAQLLHPVKHGSAQAQQHLLCIKLRDALVRSRVGLINAVRFTLKSLGHRVSNPSSESFHRTVLSETPKECRSFIEPLVDTLAKLSAEIKGMERSIQQLARKEYPQAQKLQQIEGVGPITALYFVLKIESPERFSNTRDIGAYLGLCPRRDQSGGTDKQLPISKCGDGYLRCLLVNAAHYILGPFGPPSALKAHGLKLMATGSHRAKKKAIIAIARKLAVLMLSLWKSGQSYQRQSVPA